MAKGEGGKGKRGKKKDGWWLSVHRRPKEHYEAKTMIDAKGTKGKKKRREKKETSYSLPEKFRLWRGTDAKKMWNTHKTVFIQKEGEGKKKKTAQKRRVKEGKKWRKALPKSATQSHKVREKKKKERRGPYKKKREGKEEEKGKKEPRLGVEENRGVPDFSGSGGTLFSKGLKSTIRVNYQV